MMQCDECDRAVTQIIAQDQMRERDERVAANLIRSELPKEYRDGSRSFPEIPQEIARPIRCECDKDLGSTTRGIYLYGNAGTYKTSVAASYLALAIATRDVTGLYVFMPDLMADIHASYSDPTGESRTQLVRRLIAVQCLVHDDLGKEKASEHAAGVIFEILDGRYRNWHEGMWTIVTSNFRVEALTDRFPEYLGDPIQRRIAEMTIQVEMTR